MKIFAKLLVCAFCAAIPMTHAATPTAKAKHGVKAVKKSVKTGKRGKSLKAQKRTGKPRATQAAAQALPLPAVPVLAMSAVTAPDRQAPVEAPAVPQAAPRNPYLAAQYANAPTNSYLQQPAVNATPGVNPYVPKPATAPMPWVTNAEKPVQAWTPPAPAMPAPPAVTPVYAPTSGANPYMASSAPTTDAPASSSAPAPSSASANNSKFLPSPLAQLDPMQDLSGLFSSLRMNIPALNGQDLLPTIKKVYPTGEKPLVILSFKCPTEMVGVSTPPMKALHEIVNYAFDGINKTNLLSFNMQQVCQ